MRFYYDDVSIASSGLFASSINIPSNTPTSVHTLKYVYLGSSAESSGAHIGYKFDYSPYGMIREVTQSRGMVVNSSSTTSPGSVTNEGTMAAQTIYDYPTSGIGLTEVPSYGARTDDWAGRTTASAPAYSFSNSTGTAEKLSTVTAPDGTVTVTHTVDNPSDWKDGFVSDIYVQDGSSTVLTRTQLDWERDGSDQNPRVYQMRVTDVPSSTTKSTVLYYTSYNNVSVSSERDFTYDGSVSGTELRKTETTYVTSSNYINRHLLHLPETISVVQGGSSNKVSRIDYAYDDYGASDVDMIHRADIVMHDAKFDPFGGSYVSSTDYRGNVTSVKTYADANSSSGTITHATTYDIAGNAITAEVDCCQLKSFTYSGYGTTGHYKNLISVTSGNPSGTHLTTSATYDEDTGLLGTTTDENSQVTTNYYNSDSLRLDHVDYPDGGVTSYTYADALSADSNGKYHYYVETSTKLDGSGGSTRYVVSRHYFDGRGAVARTLSNYTSANGWSTQDIEYDSMGRACRTGNPYFASSDAAAINSAGFWTTSTFDHLGRVTAVTMPRGDDDNSLTTSVTTTYEGVYITATDQAGKTRRQKVDAMGRVVRVDEPTTSGLGSTSSPNQPTSYEYDLLDNLVHIHQDAQDRYFKYDSLSRMIREKQTEQETNSSYNLSDSWNTAGTWTGRFDYNSSGRVTDKYDARSVHAHFSYDDLNRVTQIEYLKPVGGSEVAEGTPTAHYYYDSQSLPSGAPGYTPANTQGRLLAMTYGSGTPITGNYFSYDTMGRVTTQRQVTGSTTYGLSYTYNKAWLLST